MKCTTCSVYGLLVSILLHSSIAFAYFYWNPTTPVSEKGKVVLELSLSEFTVVKEEKVSPTKKEPLKPKQQQVIEQPVEPILAKPQKIKPVKEEEIRLDPINKPPIISQKRSPKLEPKAKVITKPKPKPKTKVVTKAKKIATPKPKIKQKPKTLAKAKKVIIPKPKKIVKVKAPKITKPVSKPVLKAMLVTDSTKQSMTSQNKFAPSKAAQKSKVMINNNEEIIKHLKNKYRETVLNLIKQNKYYPKRARRMHKEGSVIIEFTLDNIGQLKDVQIIKLEGHSLFKKAAIKAIKRSGKFPPFPKQISKKEWSFRTKLVYQLK